MKTSLPHHNFNEYSSHGDEENNPLWDLMKEVQNELGKLKIVTKTLEAEKKHAVSHMTDISTNTTVDKSLPDQNEWISTKELLSFIPVSKRTLQNYRDQGKIPFVRFHGKIFYSKQQIKVYLNAKN